MDEPFSPTTTKQLCQNSAKQQQRTMNYSNQSKPAQKTQSSEAGKHDNASTQGAPVYHVTIDKGAAVNNVLIGNNTIK